MTVLQLFPHLQMPHRRWLSFNMAGKYKAITGELPKKVQEGEFMVCDYPDSYLSAKALAVIARFKKKYPDLEYQGTPKPKRRRITHA